MVPEAVLNNENPRTNPKGFNGLITGISGLVERGKSCLTI